MIILPLIGLVRNNYEWTNSDTRIMAKEWIEANVPARARILMDGSRSRFIQSPPLNGDMTTVGRRLAQVSKRSREGKTVSRGISQRMLRLYREARKGLDGPTYELHSTVWGLAVQDPSYYVRNCFDYIIMSSEISKLYSREINRKSFPKSARFYEQLDKDSRFRREYFIDPLPWERSGPTISVYKVLSPCGAYPT